MRGRWLAAIVFLFVWSLTTHGKYSASGDEPHYLMITQSLAADGDLDLANNYADNDGRLFGHDGLAMGLHAVRTRTGRTLSIHDVGVGVVWFSLKAPREDDKRLLLAVMLLIGVLPWMHHKYLLYVPGLVWVVAWHRWPLIRTAPGAAIAACTAMLLPQLALFGWTWHEWGTLGGALTTEGVPFSLAALKTGAIGLWIDRQSGLLAYAPVYWVMPACVALTWRRTWPFLLPAIMLYLPAAAFVIGWWAGFAPAARYLVPAMPLLLVPMAAALRFSTVRGALCVLAVFQAAIDIVVWQHPRALWPAPQGNPALALLGVVGRAYESALPAIQSSGVTMNAVWLCAAAAIVSGAVVSMASGESTIRH